MNRIKTLLSITPLCVTVLSGIAVAAPDLAAVRDERASVGCYSLRPRR